MNVSELPKAEYKQETTIMCPECGWSGNNDEDTSATFHEAIVEKHDEESDEDYFHCTCCGTDFRK